MGWGVYIPRRASAAIRGARGRSPRGRRSPATQWRVVGIWYGPCVRNGSHRCVRCWRNRYVRYGRNRCVRYWRNRCVRYWRNRHVRYWRNRCVRYWRSRFVRYWRNRCVRSGGNGRACERCERNIFSSFQMCLNPNRPMREPVHIEHREQMVDRRNHHKRQVHLHSHKPSADRTKRTLANVAVRAHRARASLTPAGERKHDGDARGENAAGHI